MVPFHQTTEIDKNPVPVRFIIKPGLPAIFEEGFMLINVGAGGFTVNGSGGFEVPPPGAGLVTVILNIPTVGTEEMTVVNWVAETYMVFNPRPFQLMVDEVMKLVPLTVNVKPGSPWVLEEGFKLVMVGSGLMTSV